MGKATLGYKSRFIVFSKDLLKPVRQMNETGHDKSISTNILNVMIRSDPTTAQLPLLPSPPMSLRLDWRDSG